MIKWQLAKYWYPSWTHSCARMTSFSPAAAQKSLTLSGPYLHMLFPAAHQHPDTYNQLLQDQNTRSTVLKALPICTCATALSVRQNAEDRVVVSRVAPQNIPQHRCHDSIVRAQANWPFYATNVVHRFLRGARAKSLTHQRLMLMSLMIVCLARTTEAPGPPCRHRI